MHTEISLKDGEDAFTILSISARQPVHTILFSVGAGGNPNRHVNLLTALADSGCHVIAPHFERLTGGMTTESELTLRMRRLSLSLDYAATKGYPVNAAGHSIGATMLLGMTGGDIWTSTRKKIASTPDVRIGKISLFAPAMDFFRVPGALDQVRLPVQVWCGLNDTKTPPEQTRFLVDSLKSSIKVDARYIEGAGHFSFMNELPPAIVDPMPDREAFLNNVAKEVVTFLTSKH